MGLNLSSGLLEYQRKKRKETETKIIFSLLSSQHFLGWYDVWQHTRIWKNNINIILENMINQKKIVRLGPFNIRRIYFEFPDGRLRLFQREISISVFLPIIKHPDVLQVIKNDHNFIMALRKKPVRDHLKQNSSYLKKQYGRKNIEQTFVEERISNPSWWIQSDLKQINYAASLGVNLLRIYIVLNKIPKNL